MSPGFLGEMSKAVSKRAHVTLAQTSGTCPRNVQCPNEIYPDGMSMVITASLKRICTCQCTYNMSLLNGNPGEADACLDTNVRTHGTCQDMPKSCLTFHPNLTMYTIQIALGPALCIPNSIHGRDC